MASRVTVARPASSVASPSFVDHLRSFLAPIGILAGHAFVLLVIFKQVWPFVYSQSADTYLYFEYATKAHAGRPYVDFPIEYPPLGGLTILLPALLATDFPTFNALFAVEILLVDLVMLFPLVALGRRLGARWQGWQPAGVLGVFLLLTGSIVTERYDLWPVMTTIVALWAFDGGRHRLGWLALAAGSLLKLYPIVLAPIFFFDAVRRHGWRRAPAQLLWLLGPLVAGWLAFALAAPGGLAYFLSYHGQRGVEVESMYGAALMFASLLGLPVQLSLSHGSLNVFTALAAPLASAALPLTVGALALVYWNAWRSRPPDDARVRTRMLTRQCALAVLGFILFNKVFSAQYVLWLAPFVVLAGQTREQVVFAVLSLMTQTLYPYNWMPLQRLELRPIALLVARNLYFLYFAARFLGATTGARK